MRIAFEDWLLSHVIFSGSAATYRVVYVDGELQSILEPGYWQVFADGSRSPAYEPVEHSILEEVRA